MRIGFLAFKQVFYSLHTVLSTPHPHFVPSVLTENILETLSLRVLVLNHIITNYGDRESFAE